MPGAGASAGARRADEELKDERTGPVDRGRTKEKGGIERQRAMRNSEEGGLWVLWLSDRGGLWLGGGRGVRGYHGPSEGSNNKIAG